MKMTGFTSWFCYTNHVALGKFLDLSEPQFFQLHNGDNNSVHLTVLLVKIKRVNICKACRIA